MSSPSENLAGSKLLGQRRDGHWKVLNKAQTNETSGGTFSVAYEAVHDDGTHAFLKATDVGLLARPRPGVSRIDQMQRAINEQSFERQVLDFCSGNNMDRVVTVMDYGDFEIEHEGIRDIVFFIVFEKAKGDVRSSAFEKNIRNPSWFLATLHNIAVGLSQLHRQKIAHNDVKPSNVLIFTEALQKLGDLGRATAEGIIGPWDSMACVGDRTYVPPEQWGYKVDIPRVMNRVSFTVRAPADIYLLGSLGYFFLSGASFTPSIHKYLQPQHRPENWTEGFTSVLPFLVDAHSLTIGCLDPAIRANWEKKHHESLLELVPLVRALTYPDPAYRGDPEGVIGTASRHSLQRIISLFDRLAKRAQRN